VPEHDVIYIDPFDLISHEVNQSIYKDAPDEEFMESIKALGILEPIIVWVNDELEMIVISGHRRMNAARLLHMEKVPVIVRRDVGSDDEAVQILILSNRQRDKTNEQRAREYAVLKEVESRLSLARKSAGIAVEAEGKTGRARDIAAKAVGLSGLTADKAQVVLEEIDAAEAADDDERAEMLRKTLNRSVSKAHKKVVRERSDLLDEAKVVVPDSLRQTFENARGMRGLIYKVGEIRAISEVLSTEEGGQLLPLPQIQADCSNISEALISGRPHAVCPICKGRGCDGCDSLGWMHRDQYNALPKKLKEGPDDVPA